LASEIPNEKERIQFLEQLDKSGFREGTLAKKQDSQSRYEITSEEVDEASKGLAYHVGPLASRLVKKAAKLAKNKEDFYQQLAEHIPDKKERAAFLKKKIKS